MRLLKSLLVGLIVGVLVFVGLFANFAESEKTTKYSSDSVRCFVTKKGDHFHHYDCKYISGKDVIETNTVQASADGYYVCSSCGYRLYNTNNSKYSSFGTVKTTILVSQKNSGFTLSRAMIINISIAAFVLGFAVTLCVTGSKKKSAQQIYKET